MPKKPIFIFLLIFFYNCTSMPLSIIYKKVQIEQKILIICIYANFFVSLHRLLCTMQNANIQANKF